MITARLVVSTCGTSLLTHEAPQATRSLLHEVANLQKEEIDAGTLAKVDDLLNRQRARLQAASISETRLLSAELNGIIGLYGDSFPHGARQDLHLLLTTDTYVGRASAAAVEERLRVHNLSVHQPYAIRHLATHSIETLNAGVQELVDWCESTLPGYRQQYHIVFNLTGGFKAVQGVLNTLAHAYADEVVYIFEGSPNLLRIPSLPVSWDPVGIARRHLVLLRRLEVEDQIPAEDASDLPPSLVLVEGGKAARSLVGDIVWRKAKPILYAERLLEPPSTRIRYTSRFRDDVRALSEPERVAHVNERIDHLARLVRGDSSRQLQSMKVDRVRGRHPSLPQVTHECYAWSDGAARRIYFHYESGDIMLDALGPHL